MYFIGNTKELTSSHLEIIQNLRCPSLSDYKWYKDTFLTYVLQRKDANENYWKEKFVSGLPTLFSQRIRQKLRDHCGTIEIPWHNLTYDHLFSFIKKEVLALCTK